MAAPRWGLVVAERLRSRELMKVKRLSSSSWFFPSPKSRPPDRVLASGTNSNSSLIYRFESWSLHFHQYIDAIILSRMDKMPLLNGSPGWRYAFKWSPLLCDNYASVGCFRYVGPKPQRVAFVRWNLFCFSWSGLLRETWLPLLRETFCRSSSAVGSWLPPPYVRPWLPELIASSTCDLCCLSWSLALGRTFVIVSAMGPWSPPLYVGLGLPLLL